ncbi:alpha/beta hydrolase [Algihabitans albus]|uniref:alpha/beta hydrolase n=1 Tax=Algihabitans albus TaxID=2164067 RepID=UPI000E5D9021|nr:alpha/beta fold hydrolase [Algihabitans albus]
MPDRFEIAPGESLSFAYTPPTTDGGFTFVFVNALTGTAESWEADIAPALRAAGHGTLTWDLRGQGESETAAETRLDAELASADLNRVVQAARPTRPLLVGLSIGGLFAARAWLKGTPAEGLVLINTLRKSSLRLDWVNAAVFRAAKLGGAALLQDLFLPNLVGSETLAKLRTQRLTEESYEPLDPAEGAYRLLQQASAADWDVPYEDLTLPVLVLTGMKDRLFYEPADVADLTARLPQPETRTFEDYGHLLSAEAPAAVVEALLEFAGSNRAAQDGTVPDSAGR